MEVCGVTNFSKPSQKTHMHLCTKPCLRPSCGQIFQAASYQWPWAMTQFGPHVFWQESPRKYPRKFNQGTFGSLVEDHRHQVPSSSPEMIHRGSNSWCVTLQGQPWGPEISSPGTGSFDGRGEISNQPDITYRTYRII